jgi:hypothetical protein
MTAWTGEGCRTLETRNCLSPGPDFVRSTLSRLRGLWEREEGALRASLLRYFATNPASVISDLLSASSSSRNFSIASPFRKIGFSACFSM